VVRTQKLIDDLGVGVFAYAIACSRHLAPD
jgi:hypothetical protein